ncbi:MAG TPA: RNA polymerase sigma factor [Candidatus Kapabacteria bacterium]|jgi:RNA polymerase sigma-70 factor (ECF subfamily)|nr:RNA polymerase sigma factor [Candidatus Kapabacteria bacterium]
MVESEQLQDFSRSEDGPESETDRPRFDPDSAASQPDRDTEVFQRFLAGSDEAFRLLYDLYERPLYLYIVRLMTSEVEAQDVFQEVWIRMYRLRGEKQMLKSGNVSKFSGLLFTIARNLSINAIRDRKVLPNVSLEDISPEMEASLGSLRTLEVDDADVREMLQKALAQIPVAQREAFILREYNGYSYQEIAEITGSTMINAKMRAWRARERLRKMIAAWLELKSYE